MSKKTKAQLDSERLGFVTVERYEELMVEALSYVGYGFSTILAVMLVAALTGCTYARYTDSTHTPTILDLHPTGNTVNLDAALAGKGKLSLNRESGSAEGIVSEVGDMVSPDPLD